MPENQTINIDELLMERDRHASCVVYEDDYFRRETANIKPDPTTRIDIMVDSIQNSGVSSCQISINLSQDTGLDFVFDATGDIPTSRGKLIACDRAQNLFWIPKDPVERIYDSNGQIEYAAQTTFETKSHNDRLCLAVKGKAGHRLEFSVVIFSKNVDSFRKELLSWHPVELRKVVRSDWFYYQGINDVWDYFIGPKIYSTAHRVHRKGWESQNVAFVLYYYLDFLHNRTAKRIYALLCDFIAYSLMLSLPPDNRWRHGTWTDIPETHTVHQIAGIHILLSYYQRTARDAFLLKAKDAMDFLISIADKLSDDKIWFLHDTLETNMADSSLFYKIFPSTAFGKSISNTLCINSHIATLTALHRLNQIDPSDKYSTYFEKGLSALKNVLQANPCDWLYSCAYRPRDLLIRLCMKTDNKIAKKLLKTWTLILMRHLLPFLKKKFPRIVMPNGFIERDLSHSSLSDFYHFLNIQAMLTLYSRTKTDWLLKQIKKSVEYSAGTCLADYVFGRDPKAMLFLDILLLYSGIINQNYIHLLPTYLARFQKANSALPVNILSDPFITDTSLPLRVDNEKVIVLVPAAGKKLKAILVNTTQKDEKVAISLPSENAVDELEVIDSSYQKSSLSRDIIVPKMGYVKIVSKNG